MLFSCWTESWAGEELTSRIQWKSFAGLDNMLLTCIDPSQG
jgi:hypothetical protein